MKYSIVAPLLLSSSLTGTVAFADSSQAISQNKPQNEDTLVISASRHNTTLSEVPRSITVIPRDELMQQISVSRSLGDALGKLVPGMAPSGQMLTNFNQTLRGRKMLVLIDGIPQNSNRNISRDLATIDPVNIERIEVIRGGSAIYGSGASGGIISITTRKNNGESESTLALNSSLTHPEDSMGWKASHYTSGQQGNLDYGLNLAYEKTAGFFDANGDRIAPELGQGDLADTSSVNLAGKVRWSDAEQAITLSLSHLKRDQDTDYTRIDGDSGKAIAVSGLELDDQSAVENTQANLAWSLYDTPLGALDAQLYYRDSYNRFLPFDGRPYSSWNHLAQTELSGEYWGSRLTLNTPITNQSMLRWGVDFNHATEEGPALIYDGDIYDSSNKLRFVQTGQKTFVPEITQKTLGGFAQLETDLTEQLIWEAGLRYETISAEFDDYVTLGQETPIDGGKVTYDDVMFNTGLTFLATDQTEVYANFSQGFELPDLGLRLRYTSNFDADNSELEPIKTDSYEIGVRSDLGKTQLTAAVFHSTSDLGKIAIEDFSLVLPRVKERITGVELTAAHQLNSQWRLGGLMTWMKGESYDKNQARWLDMNSFRIPTLQLNTYVQFAQSAQWLHKLQLNYSADRDEAFEDGAGWGRGEVEAYTTLDYYTRYHQGQNTLSIGIENLFNKEYRTVMSQLDRSESQGQHYAAGRTLQVAYSYQW